MRDLHNNIDIIKSIHPQALTTVAGKTGDAVDRAGYQSVEIEFAYGSVTATNATLTPTLLECDTATGTFTSVANADLLGTEAAAGIAAAATRTSGVSKNVTKRLGYIGVKRYLKAKIVPTVTAATVVSAQAILGHPHNAPVAT